MALAEMQYPGWLGRLLTHPVRGLQNYAETMRLLTEEKSAIKVFVELDSLYGRTVLVCRREYLAPQRRAWLCRSRQGLRVEGAGDKDLGGRRRANTREVAGHYLRREGCTVVSAAQPSPSSSCTPNRAGKGADRGLRYG